jgi:hypothetical protein
MAKAGPENPIVHRSVEVEMRPPELELWPPYERPPYEIPDLGQALLRLAEIRRILLDYARICGKPKHGDAVAARIFRLKIKSLDEGVLLTRSLKTDPVAIMRWVELVTVALHIGLALPFETKGTRTARHDHMGGRMRRGPAKVLRKSTLNDAFEIAKPVNWESKICRPMVLANEMWPDAEAYLKKTQLKNPPTSSDWIYRRLKNMGR